MKTERELRLREALLGLAILVVGGDPRIHQTNRLRTRLGLGEVIHCPTRKSDPTSSSFRAALGNCRIALVVCARGLCRTQHGKALHEICRRLDLPLLDLNHIPHPNTLIAALIEKGIDSAVRRRCFAVRSMGGAA